ncbi:hypothetical protein GGR55DRAFT_677247 [Xylaria sp. FL0064]|nr:hypothetical protein GGR55DRAFT_677247 [Xylaria sp. FL0064]
MWSEVTNHLALALLLPARHPSFAAEPLLARGCEQHLIQHPTAELDVVRFQVDDVLAPGGYFPAHGHVRPGNAAELLPELVQRSGLGD